jgi:hypothetical protein
MVDTLMHEMGLRASSLRKLSTTRPAAASQVHTAPPLSPVITVAPSRDT